MATATSQVLIDFEARIQNAEKNIKKINSDVAGTGKAAQKSAKDMKGATKSAGAFFGKLVAGAAALRGLYNATRDNIQANAKLNAILKATGGVAGITKGNIKGIVKELKSYTGESEATIKNTAAMLLTFKNINKDIFPDTLKVTADLAAAMGTDLKSASIQVGKALNDPATGMTALVRSGITFSDEQKKLITGFQKTNQLGKAQAIILKELQSQFGGTAAALNATPIGQVETAMNQFKDALAAIGKVVLPIFGAIIGAVGDFVTSLLKAGPVVKVAAAAIAVAVGALTGPVGLIVGLVSAVGLLGSMQKGLDDLTSEIKETTKGFNDLGKQKTLLTTLKNMKRGTKEYENTLAKIIKLNPKLANSNLQVEESYDKIANAVNAASKEQAQYLKGIAKLQLAETTKIIGKSLVDVTFGKASSKQQKQLEKSFLLLGKAAAQAGTPIKEAWSEQRIFLKSLEDGGNLATGTYTRLLSLYKKGYRGIKTMTTEVRKFQKASSQTTLTPDTDKGKQAIFDLAKYAFDVGLMFEDEYNKKRLQAEAEYQKDIAKIKAAQNLSADKKILAKEYAMAKKNNALIAIDKQEQDVKAAANKERQQKYVDSAKEIADITTQALEGDITGALKSGLLASGTVWGQWASLGVSAIESVISIFSSETESEIERIKREYDEIVSSFSDSGTSDAIAEFLGAATSASIGSGIRQSTNELEQLASLLGIDMSDALNDNFIVNFGENLSSEIADVQDILQTAIAGDIENLPDAYQDIWNQIRDIPILGDDYNDSLSFLQQIIQGQIEGLKQENTIYEDILSTITDIRDAEASTVLLEAQSELKDIQDEIRTGLVEEEDTLVEQIGIYDEMISALEDVAGAEELILDLKEEQYALSQQLNDENELAAYYAGEQGSALESLVAQLKQVELDIDTGARQEGTTATIGTQVSILDGIIANLENQGADPDLIADYQIQRADLLKELYGDAGFQARAGTGASVGFSVPDSYTNTANSTTTSTTENNLTISGQTIDDSTLVQKLLDEIYQQYGTNILTGA